MFQCLSDQLCVITNALKENEDRIGPTYLTPSLHGSHSAKIYKAYNGYASPLVFVTWFLDNLDWNPTDLFMGLFPHVVKWAHFEDETITSDLEATWGVHVTRIVRAQLSAARAASSTPELVTSTQAGIPVGSSPHDIAICAIIDIVVRVRAPWVQAIGRHGVVMDLSEHGFEVRASDVAFRVEVLRCILLLDDVLPTEMCTFHSIDDVCMLNFAKLVCASSLNKKLYDDEFAHDACKDRIASGQYNWLLSYMPCGMLDHDNCTRL